MTQRRKHERSGTEFRGYNHRREISYFKLQHLISRNMYIVRVSNATKINEDGWDMEMYLWLRRADLARILSLACSIFVIMSKNERSPRNRRFPRLSDFTFFHDFSTQSPAMSWLRKFENAFVKQRDVARPCLISARTARSLLSSPPETSRFFHSQESRPVEATSVDLLDRKCRLFPLVEPEQLFVNIRMKSRARNAKSRVGRLFSRRSVIKQFYFTRISAPSNHARTSYH